MGATFLDCTPLRQCPDAYETVQLLSKTVPLLRSSLLPEGVKRVTRRAMSCKRYVKSDGIQDQSNSLNMRTYIGVIRNRRGTSALEFALVAPVLFMLVFGIIQLGITFNNFLALTDGVRAASRVLAASRSSAVPLTSAKNAIYVSAPNLTPTSLTITVAVGGASCVSDGACATALTAAAGGSASVMASYPCNLTIMGVNYAPGCTLTSVTTERVE